MSSYDDDKNLVETLNDCSWYGYQKKRDQYNPVKSNYKYIYDGLYSEDMIGKPYLLAGSSLRTIDWSKTFHLLPSYDAQESNISLNTIKEDKDFSNQVMLIKNILNPKECDSIIQKCTEKTLQEIQKQNYNRDSERLVVFDNSFAAMIWERLTGPLVEKFAKQDVKLFPLGFNVLKGSWEISGINCAMRFNQYKSCFNGRFGPHRDAQFCPSGDKRSFLSVVIYLNNEFEGGETKFYFPKTNSHNCKDMTMQEEIERNGGLDNGYDEVVVEPKQGHAVIFSQNIIHESTPLIHSGKDQYKYIIKTDVILQRCGKGIGFSVNETEKKDYMKCLDYFRRAQQIELNGNNKNNDFDHDEHNASELYEKCISLRYSYPTTEMVESWIEEGESHPIVETKYFTNSVEWDSQSEDFFTKSQESCISDLGLFTQLDLKHKQIPFLLFPAEVWMLIMTSLTEGDRISVVSAYPGLENVKRKLNHSKLIPQVLKNKGVFTKFKYTDLDFVVSNIEDCSRLLAIYSVFLLGHCADSNTYTIKYDAHKNEAVVIDLHQLLSDIFYKEASYGAVLNVVQQNDSKQPKRDLRKSVDRRFMATAFNQEFFGDSVLNTEFNCIERLFEHDSDDEFDSFDSDDVMYQDLVNHWDKCYWINGKEFNYGDNSELDNDDYDNDLTAIPQPSYLQHLGKFKNSNHVGAAMVRVLKKPSHIESPCVCPIGGGVGAVEITNNCATEIFNHLITDFGKHEFKVRKVDKNEDCCPFLEQLHYKLKRKGENGFLASYNVNVTPIQSDKMSFQHASCQCNFPGLSIDKYINLRSYPYLNHVHVVFVKQHDSIFAWTSYGGVAAL